MNPLIADDPINDGYHTAWGIDLTHSPGCRKSDQTCSESTLLQVQSEAFEILKSDTDFFDLDLNAIKQLLDGFVNPQMDQILFTHLTAEESRSFPQKNLVQAQE